MSLEDKLREDLNRFSRELEQAAEAERSARERVIELGRFVSYLRSTLEESESDGKLSPPLSNRIRHRLFLRGTSPSIIIRQILKEAGTPLHVRDISKRAIEKGYGAPNAAIEKVLPNLSSLLSKSAQRPSVTGIRRAGRGMFELVEKQKTEDASSD